MPKAKCPSCATVVAYVAGYDPICPQCGFNGAAPPVHRTAPALWSSVPSAGPAQTMYASQGPSAQPVQTYAPSTYAPPAYAPTQGYAPAPGAPGYGRQQGMAVAALVCGIAGIIAPPVSLAAVVLGAVAMANADRDPQRYGGKGMAVAGLVLGILFFLFWISMWGSRSMWDDDWMWGW